MDIVVSGLVRHCAMETLTAKRAALGPRLASGWYLTMSRALAGDNLALSSTYKLVVHAVTGHHLHPTCHNEGNMTADTTEKRSVTSSHVVRVRAIILITLIV